MPNSNVHVRNPMLDVLNELFSEGRMRGYSGSRPASSRLAPTGDLLADITLPEVPFAAADGGAIEINGLWQDAAADDGDDTPIGYWRLSGPGDDGSEDGAFPRIDFGASEVIADGTVTAGQAVTVEALTLGLPES